jgi:predicted nucleic acid-binding protein
METKSKIIIADSSGLISLLIDTDSNHAAAHDIAAQLTEDGTTVLIPSEVLAETINILGKKFGHEQTAQVIDDLFQSAAFTVTPSSDVMRKDALSRFRETTGSISYTDCLVMAVADHYGVTAIFGFDEIFSKQGYQLPGNKVGGEEAA